MLDHRDWFAMVFMIVAMCSLIVVVALEMFRDPPRAGMPHRQEELYYMCVSNNTYTMTFQESVEYCDNLLGDD